MNIATRIVKQLLRDYGFGDYGGLKRNAPHKVWVEYGEESDTLYTFSPGKILDCVDKNAEHAREEQEFIRNIIGQKLEI